MFILIILLGVSLIIMILDTILEKKHSLLPIEK